MRWRKLCVAVLGVILADVSFAGPFEMDVLETDELRLLYFDPFQTYLTPHVTRTYHNSLEFQKYIFDWTPYDKPTVILQDFSDYGHGAALVAPNNMLLVDIGPRNHTLETTPSSERFFMLMNHELVHISTLDAANEQDRKWRRFFGGKVRQTDEHPESILYNYLTVPRISIPRWYAEGSAVFMETWLSGGIGRSQGAFDEMVFRAMVRDDAQFYSNLGVVSKGSDVDFQVGVNAYLYGTRFFGYLAYQYSPEKVVEWLKRGEDSKRYYATQFKHVFGKDLETAWDEWIVFEIDFQHKNLASVRKHPLTTVKPLTEEALGSASRSFVDPVSRRLVGGFRYPGVVAHIGSVSLEDGTMQRLADIKGPILYRVTSPAFDAGSRSLFYTADNFAYRDLMVIDVDTGEDRMLIEDARIGDLSFVDSDRTLWGLRHVNGIVSLVRLAAPYEEWTQVYSWSHGTVAFELDVSKDGELLSVSEGEVNGDQFLRVYRVSDMGESEVKPIAQFDFGTAIPEGFVFSPDSRYLFGSSYYTGVSNIFRYEIASGEIEAVSNAETGFFRPIPMDDGTLIVYEFTGQGFRPVVIDPVPLEDVGNISFLGNEIVRKHPALMDWSVVGTLADQPFEQIVTHEGKYRPYRELGFSSWYPIIQGYRDEIALGANLQWQDPVGLHRFELNASYSWNTPSDESVHLSAEYQALNWWARYWHNYADFYDLFGPTERSRKGDAFFVGYDKALILDDPKRLDFYSELAYYTGLDTLPNNQNRPSFFIEDILTFKAGLEFEHTRRSLGAVDHEKGWRWNAEGRVDRSEFDTIPKLRGGIDFGFALPWKHSSVWFYNFVGWADGNRLDPLTNFYFGGFGNNYVDNREVKRYRRYYSMPGFEIDEIGGREFGKITAEFNFPPVRFSEAGKPGFFLKHIRPAVFASGLITDPGERFERTTASVGFQLDLEFTLIHRLPMTMSVGWAAGYEDGDRRDGEWMVSLKIL